VAHGTGVRRRDLELRIAAWAPESKIGDLCAAALCAPEDTAGLTLPLSRFFTYAPFFKAYNACEAGLPLVRSPLSAGARRRH
jgi:hypothetical protein